QSSASTTVTQRPEYQVVTAAGAYTATATAATSGKWAAAIVTYKILTPIVTAIAPAGATPTNAGSVDFTVTFNQPVYEVATSAFALTTTPGVSAASVTSVSGSGTTRTVTVDAGSGDGTIRLDLTDTD